MVKFKNLVVDENAPKKPLVYQKEAKAKKRKKWEVIKALTPIPRPPPFFPQRLKKNDEEESIKVHLHLKRIIDE